MRIEYLTGNDFSKACLELSTRIQKTFSPDLAIGVLTGGGVVGREMLKSWDLRPQPEYFELAIKRALTKKKERFNVRSLLRILPRFTTELLIKIEVWYLEKFKNESNSERNVLNKDREEIEKVLKRTNPKNVLIIDDCIDTGNTLKVLNDLLLNIDSSLNIKIATITTTHKIPVIKADFSLYDRTICRFPWSMEIKE